SQKFSNKHAIEFSKNRRTPQLPDVSTVFTAGRPVINFRPSPMRLASRFSVTRTHVLCAEKSAARSDWAVSLAAVPVEAGLVGVV
ncbi:hypothetical protein, partial [Brevibacterium daeguense]|uniref:hypothetical protein n=1 Tax=Brevibacterium daeguense TaxID=909936 RepID=UPI0031D6E33D